MGFFDWLKRKPSKKEHTVEYSLNGTYPNYFSNLGGNVYASDVVQQAIYSIVTELKKVDPVHIRKVGNDFVSVEGSGSVQGVLDNPNPLMTTSDFIEKIAWTLLLNYNAFVYPVWEGSKLTALYPLQPQQVEFLQDQSGKLWIGFTFGNGLYQEMPYEDVIHIRYKFSVSEFMGGNLNGQPDLKPLLDTLKLNDTLLQGLAKSLNLQTTINGVVKLRGMYNDADQQKKIAEFEKKLQSNQSGLLPLDVSAEYIPITKQVNLLDEKVLKFLDKKVLRFFGVSDAIVDADFTPAQFQAFYQKTLEPIVKSLSQAFTKGLFTKHQAQGFNNKIMFYVKELIFMNNAEKLQFFTNAINIGGCYVNEYRTAFGLRPINELQGVRMQSLNFVNSEYAKDYQLNTQGKQAAQNGGVGNGE